MPAQLAVVDADELEPALEPDESLLGELEALLLDELPDSLLVELSPDPLSDEEVELFCGFGDE